jgi:hypothetical protein
MSDGKLMWGLVVVGAVAALAVWWSSLPTPVAEPAAASSPSTQRPAPAFRLAGTSSCSARSCHGGVGPLGEPIHQDEYTRWLAHDRHANAYQVLREEPSKQIARNLDLKKPPHEEARCLACHTNPEAAGLVVQRFLERSPGDLAGQRVREEITFGVGCESCHGAAEKWLVPHTQPGWAKKLTKQEQKDYGWQPMGDLTTRAQTCVGCHIGAPADGKHGLPGRDMNHDLIAAGHPRLNFELGAFLANMPPHWNEKGKDQSPAQVWAVGQVCSTEAALKLLADRADAKDLQLGDRANPKNDRPWPEVAEYGCFACHHDLSEPSWRQKRGYGNRTPGSLSFGTWYLAVPRALASQQGLADEPFKDLAESMGKAYPDRRKVGQQAKTAATQMENWREKLRTKPYAAASLRELLLDLTKDQSQIEWDWDTAEQLYLATLALSEAEGKAEEWAKRIRDLSRKRAFPTNAANPKENYASPKDFEPEPFRKLLRDRILDK